MQSCTQDVTRTDSQLLLEIKMTAPDGRPAMDLKLLYAQRENRPANEVAGLSIK